MPLKRGKRNMPEVSIIQSFMFTQVPVRGITL